MKITFEFLATMVFVIVMLYWFAFAGIFVFRKKLPKAQGTRCNSRNILIILNR
jgi:hypothetical protein